MSNTEKRKDEIIADAMKELYDSIEQKEKESVPEVTEEAEVVEILCPKCDAVVYTFERDLIIEDEEEDEE